MWVEPLTATTQRADAGTVAVTVRAADGRAVARVVCAHGAETAAFGEMRILDQNGGPRQKLRALVLLTREALRFADSLGVARVTTEAPVRLSSFAAKMCGIEPDQRAERHYFAGELHAVRTFALAVSDDAGNFTQLTQAELDALDADIALLH